MLALDFLALVVSLTIYWYARLQPFPEIGRGFATVLLFLTLLSMFTALGGYPFPTIFQASAYAFIGGIGAAVGVQHLARTRRDVLVAPFSSIIFSSSVIAILADQWNSEASLLNHITQFILALIVCCLSVYLIFRGLLIGGLQKAWSESGLRQLRRGILDGPRGAISCFEKAWDPMDESLDVMSHAALVLIQEVKAIGDPTGEHKKRLDAMGGWKAVDSTWIEAIRAMLDETGSNSGPA